MDLIAENSFTNSTENLTHKMTKGQTDCHSQVRGLIQKLSSWRDESHRQMSNILSSHIRSIDVGFNGLVEEFSDMQAQVLVLRKERNGLLETVDNLNNEIMQMGAKLTLADLEVHKRIVVKQRFQTSKMNVWNHLVSKVKLMLKRNVLITKIFYRKM